MTKNENSKTAPTEIEFLQHTLNVLRAGDEAMRQMHIETINLRLDRLKLAEIAPQILDNYQNRIDDRIKRICGIELSPEKVGKAFYGGDGR